MMAYSVETKGFNLEEVMAIFYQTKPIADF